jgi:hypothetical protein
MRNTTARSRSGPSGQRLSVACAAAHGAVERCAVSNPWSTAMPAIATIRLSAHPSSRGTRLSLRLAAPRGPGGSLRWRGGVIQRLGRPAVFREAWLPVAASPSGRPQSGSAHRLGPNLILKGDRLVHKLLAYPNSGHRLSRQRCCMLSIGLARPLGIWLGYRRSGTLESRSLAASTLVSSSIPPRAAGWAAYRSSSDGTRSGRPLWPALSHGGWVLWFAQRHCRPARLFGVAVHLAAGALVYRGQFLDVAISRRGTAEFYWTKLRGLRHSGSGGLPAAKPELVGAAREWP